MKPMILFDLDHTLFDTAAWIQEYVNPSLAEVLDVSLERITELTLEYQATLEKSTDFNPPDFLKLLEVELEADPHQLEKIFFNQEYLAHSVFADVPETLEKLKSTHRLGIFSEGVTTFQRQKLELSGLLKWMDLSNIFIFKRKLEADILQKLPPAMIVDDRLNVAEALQKYPKLQPVWLNRRQAEIETTVKTIHSLSELLNAA